MEKTPKFSVIVLNYNGNKVLRPCIESVLKSDYPNFEIILVDNHSIDGSIEDVEQAFKNEPRIVFVKNDRPRYYAGGNTIGFEHSSGDFAVFINNDTEVEKNWLNGMEALFRDTAVGAVQPKILYHYTPDTIDNVGQEMDIFGFGFGRGHKQKDRGQFDKEEEIFFASGVAFSARSSLLKQIGVFDEAYVFYYEDTDLSWRIRLAGFKILYCPASVVYHKVSKTTRVFSSAQELSFHARKNRLATLLRNYNFRNLCIFLPGTLLIYLLLYLKEIFVNRNVSLANTVILSIVWNLRNYGYNISKRRIVQTELRKINDGDIIKLMSKTPLFLKYG